MSNGSASKLALRERRPTPFRRRGDGFILMSSKQTERDPEGVTCRSTSQGTRARREHSELGPLPRFLRPLVDWVAGIKASVHTKLLAGFLLVALLLLSMGTLSIVVLGRLNRQVETLTALNRQASQARDMIYEVTAQSHYRAMALLKLGDPTWTPKIYTAKELFVANLADMRSYGGAERAGTLGRRRGGEGASSERPARA